MKRIHQLPQRGFLLLGIAIILVGGGLYNFSGGGFLFYLYFIPGVFLVHFYFVSSLTLNDRGISKRTLLIYKKHIKWKDVTIFRGTRMKTVIIESENIKIEIPDIYEDRKQIVDYIIRHIDKAKVSDMLISEWSQYFFIYQEEDNIE